MIRKMTVPILVLVIATLSMPSMAAGWDGMISPRLRAALEEFDAQVASHPSLEGGGDQEAVARLRTALRSLRSTELPSSEECTPKGRMDLALIVTDQELTLFLCLEAESPPDYVGAWSCPQPYIPLASDEAAAVAAAFPDLAKGASRIWYYNRISVPR